MVEEVHLLPKERDCEGKSCVRWNSGRLAEWNSLTPLFGLPNACCCRCFCVCFAACLLLLLLLLSSLFSVTKTPKRIDLLRIHLFALTTFSSPSHITSTHHIIPGIQSDLENVFRSIQSTAHSLSSPTRIVDRPPLWRARLSADTSSNLAPRTS